MEALIVHYHTIFDERLVSYASSPPLPPAPLEGPAPPYAYGSSHTKFLERKEPQNQFDAPLPQTPTSQATGDDFTPQLPSRPPPSIHPSSRGNTGSSNGHSNSSPIVTEAETNVASPTSYASSPPLPLRPGGRGVPTPVQSLKGTQGLDFSQPAISEGDWNGPPPASPPLSNPPSPPPSAFKAPPPSGLPHSTFAHQQQQQMFTQTLQNQEQHQYKTQNPLPEVGNIAVGGLELSAAPLEVPLSSTMDDGHSTDDPSHPTPNPSEGPTLQSVAPRSLAQQVHQVPIQVTEAPNQLQPIHSLNQPGDVSQGRRESQNEVPSPQLQ